jgi:pimeloyl-ACP methyl ester carboxylesterase
VRRLIVIDGYAGSGSVDPGVADAERQRALDRVRDRPWFADVWRAWEEGVRLVGRSEQALVDSFRGFLPFCFAEPDDPVAAAHIERLRRELRWHPPIVDAWEGEREDADYRPLVAGIRCPTLVIVGEHDWICGPCWNSALTDAWLAG